MDRINFTQSLIWSSTLVHLPYAMKELKLLGIVNQKKYGQSNWQVLHLIAYGKNHRFFL